MRQTDSFLSAVPSRARRALWAAWLAALAGLVLIALFAGCPGDLAGAADDDSGGDDDAADDDGADDDAADDDIWSDDDAGDDDGGGDDDASGACTIEIEAPWTTFVLAGSCESDPGLCEGGHDPMNPGGSCGGGLTCCIHPDQCAQVFQGTCAASEEECDGEPPPEGQFPPFGCPQATPICCLPGPPR